MKTVLVLHQLLAIIDREMRPIARKVGLTPDDVLIIAWLVDHEATSSSLLADRLGRARQNTQRSLQRLEREGLVQRYEHSITGKTAAWALTEAGHARWRSLEFAFSEQERLLADVEPRRLVDLLERAARELVIASQNICIAGLKELPERSGTGPPAWDM